MKFYFTRHAKKRMRERGILQKEVREAIRFPDRSGHQEEKFFAMKVRKNHHPLIVYYVQIGDGIKVVTVITTSKISKYLPHA